MTLENFFSSLTLGLIVAIGVPFLTSFGLLVIFTAYRTQTDNINSNIFSQITWVQRCWLHPFFVISPSFKNERHDENNSVHHTITSGTYTTAHQQSSIRQVLHQVVFRQVLHQVDCISVMKVQNSYPICKREKTITKFTYFHSLERQNTVCSSIRDFFFSDLFLNISIQAQSAPFFLLISLICLHIFFTWIFHFPQRIYIATQNLAGFILHAAVQGMESF